LKRAIERLLLLPLARAMADGRIRPHSLVRLVARNGQVQLHIPRLERAEPIPPVPPPFQGDVQTQLAALTSRVNGYSDRCADLSARKSALLARIAADDFQSRAGESRSVYEQVYVIDSVLARAENVRRGLERLIDFCAEAGQHRPRRVRQRLESFTARVEQTETLLNCQQPKYLGDAVVTLTLLSRLGAPLGAIVQLSNMYVHFARRAQFTAETLDDHQFESPAEDSISLLIAGVGAYALLGAESGLHVATNNLGRDHEQEQREVIRIDVAALDPAGPGLQRNDVQLDIHPLKGRSGRLVKRLSFDVRAMHAPTATALRIWTGGERANLIERVLPLLQARISAAAEGQPRHSTTPVIRRYKFGPSQLVRDLRTGRRTGRLKAMLAGHIAPFLLPITEEAPSNERPDTIEH
jgi:protein subunit release factor A